MFGAIAGDVIGSVYEHAPIKTKEFPLFSERSRFTDDTVLTIAVAETIIDGYGYQDTLKSYARRYPDAGYGSHFWRWAHSERLQPYNSWGNGSAMRVSPIGFAFETTQQVLEQAERSAAVTHNHPEGIKGAQATALAILLARKHRSKELIRADIQRRFGYDLERQIDEIRPGYHFDVSCQGSVPEALIAFLDSDDYEDAVRNAVSLGGDSDTLACIAGGIAQAYYGSVPDAIADEVWNRLPEQFCERIQTFNDRFNLSSADRD